MSPDGTVALGVVSGCGDDDVLAELEGGSECIVVSDETGARSRDQRGREEEGCLGTWTVGGPTA